MAEFRRRLVVAAAIAAPAMCAAVPGTLMPIQIADGKTRADVIAYLAALKKE